MKLEYLHTIEITDARGFTLTPIVAEALHARLNAAVERIIADTLGGTSKPAALRAARSAFGAIDGRQKRQAGEIERAVEIKREIDSGRAFLSYR
ncbi:MAG: hypothetical protein ACOY3N_23490 [Bradyrhizobium sp.]|uniref:hypothetical protein n=1 Tax=Bradyrhizobium sp. TaxID=376 RepID=UPI003BF406EA